MFTIMDGFRIGVGLTLWVVVLFVGIVAICGLIVKILEG